MSKRLQAALLSFGAFMAAPQAATALSPHIPTDGIVTEPPIGHVQFCAHTVHHSASWRPLCSSQVFSSAPLPVFDTAYLGHVDVINRRVNDAIEPQDDHLSHPGFPEVWLPGGQHGFGDCEDYVMAKILALRYEMGLPMHLMSIALVKDSQGRGHAVGLLHTTQGTLVLDNLRDEILPWHQTGYDFVKMQSRIHNAYWVNIIQPREQTVGAPLDLRPSL